jgi:diguanylate cyclase (GGDEF)-like protein
MEVRISPDFHACQRGPIPEHDERLGAAPERVPRYSGASGIELLAFTRKLLLASDEQRVADLVAKELLAAFAAEFAAVYLWKAGRPLQPAAWSGNPALALIAGAEAERLLVESNETSGPGTSPVVAEPSQLELEPPQLRVVALPVAADRPLGVLAVVLEEQVSRRFDHDLFTAVAYVCASAIENVRLKHEALREARRDQLTGLGNRRAFDELLVPLLSQPVLAALTHDVTLVLFDVDDFKRVNDRLGHEAGDDVLRSVARALLRATRTSEQAFRLGGDEFALVVRGGSASGIRVAERAQLAAFAQLRTVHRPSLSAGVASFPRDAASKEELLRKADSALYAAKRRGKGRVLSFGNLEIRA